MPSWRRGRAERRERALTGSEKRILTKRGGIKAGGKEIGQDMNKMKHISESARQEEKKWREETRRSKKVEGTERVFMRGWRDL